MTILSDIARWDRKFAWSTFSFVLAVFFGGITIYNEFLKNTSPSLAVNIVSDTNVLDVKENIPELKISYGDEDIKTLNQTLSVVVFRVENSGGSAILNAFYDEKATPALTLLAGRVVKVEQVAATSAYLMNVAQPTLVGQSRISLPQVILEPGESYTLKALLLHGPRTGLPFRASGKVAGVREIAVIGAEAAPQKASFWSSVVSGSIPTQLARAPIYFFGFSLLLLGTYRPIAFLLDRIQVLSRILRIRKFKRHYRGEINAPKRCILDVYKKKGLRPLVRIREVLGNEKKLRKAIKWGEGVQGDHERTPLELTGFQTAAKPDSRNRYRGLLSDYDGIPTDILRDLNIASVAEDGTCVVNKELWIFLEKFIDYVNI